MTILTNTNAVIQVGNSTFQIAQRDLDYGAGVFLIVAVVYVACRLGARFTMRETRLAAEAQAAAEARSASAAKLAKHGISVGR